MIGISGGIGFWGVGRFGKIIKSNLMFGRFDDRIHHSFDAITFSHQPDERGCHTGQKRQKDRAHPGFVIEAKCQNKESDLYRIKPGQKACGQNGPGEHAAFRQKKSGNPNQSNAGNLHLMQDHIHCNGALVFFEDGYSDISEQCARKADGQTDVAPGQP